MPAGKPVSSFYTQRLASENNRKLQLLNKPESKSYMPETGYKELHHTMRI